MDNNMDGVHSDSLQQTSTGDGAREGSDSEHTNFSGQYQHIRSENFDEYLGENGNFQNTSHASVEMCLFLYSLY